MRRMLVSTIAVVATVAGLAACTKHTSAGSTAMPALRGPAAVPITKLTVSAALTTESGKALSAAFHATNPYATVEIQTGTTKALVTRLQAEFKSRRVRTDAILLDDPTVMPSLASAGIIGTYEPPAARQLPSDMVGSGWFAAFNFYNVIMYKTGTTPAPKDWSDLTNPAYKGKIEMSDPSYSGTTLAMAAEVPKLAGSDFFSQLNANRVRIARSPNSVGKSVTSGARPIGVTLDSVYRPLAAKGSPVHIVWPTSGAIPVPAPAAVIKGHESTGAEAFLSWLLSSHGQHELAKLGYTPALRNIPAVPPIPSGTKVVTVPYQSLIAQRSAILNAFAKVSARIPPRAPRTRAPR